MIMMAPALCQIILFFLDDFVLLSNEMKDRQVFSLVNDRIARGKKISRQQLMRRYITFAKVNLKLLATIFSSIYCQIYDSKRKDDEKFFFLEIKKIIQFVWVSLLDYFKLGPEVFSLKYRYNIMITKVLKTLWNYSLFPAFFF